MSETPHAWSRPLLGLARMAAACACTRPGTHALAPAPHINRHSKLATFLPLKVRHRDASAKWDAAKSALTVEMPIDKSDSLLG